MYHIKQSKQSSKALANEILYTYTQTYTYVLCTHNTYTKFITHTKSLQQVIGG